MSRIRLMSPIATMALFGLLGACGGSDSSDDRGLVERLTLGSFEAPEEFAILPQKPLEVPEDLTTLPAPTPGAVSRVDLTPETDALVALSGRPEKAPAAASDNALLAAAGARGRQPGIRAQLSAEDEVYRENNRGLLLDRLFGKVSDGDIYGSQVLDPEAELLRLRALGIWVPQLPPSE
ncbi:DUF3035 domain-containing protein [Oceanibium sediminis]|uniref:DUF3035 domain-containing protein n=1 Tax=Oceanibium sediminis TaxID=2026339 RepID=UPI00130024E6|nr:DUF3035 domain-containing protein [Oceanibium sediminis]